MENGTRPASRGLMVTDELDIVAVRIAHETRVVVRVNVRQQFRCAVVASTSNQRRGMTGFDRRATGAVERNVRQRLRGAAAAQPEVEMGDVGAESIRLSLHRQAVTEG